MTDQHSGQPGGGRQAPFGQGVAPGVALGQAAPAPGLPSNTNRALVAVGLGCGLLVLTAMLLGGGAVFWIKAKGTAAIDELTQMRESARVAAASKSFGSDAPSNPALSPKGDCHLALNCCRMIAARSSSDAAAAAACEVFSNAGYPQATCTAALVGYRQAAAALGTACE